jgi:hypothetical protein
VCRDPRVVTLRVPTLGYGTEAFQASKTRL